MALEIDFNIHELRSLAGRLQRSGITPGQHFGKVDLYRALYPHHKVSLLKATDCMQVTMLERQMEEAGLIDVSKSKRGAVGWELTEAATAFEKH